MLPQPMTAASATAASALAITSDTGALPHALDLRAIAEEKLAGQLQLRRGIVQHAVIDVAAVTRRSDQFFGDIGQRFAPGDGVLEGHEDHTEIPFVDCHTGESILLNGKRQTPNAER